ncbi:MAG: hypothetical protein R3C49_12265 [Planctomycetaceae bacterium]
MRHSEDGVTPTSPPGTLPDHTSEIKARLLEAFNDNGILEFEAGKTYRTTEIRIWQNGNGLPSSPPLSSPRLMPAAIEGNGATLKWVENDEPSPGSAILYLWNPQKYGNEGFYIRNLTIDCGNNAIGGLADPAHGQMSASDEACDYGLRLWGGDSLLVENVAVLRAASAGVLVQSSTSNSVGNTVFRHVNARYGANRGWWFSDNQQGSTRIDVELENCYATMNMGEGFYIDDAHVFMVGCGSEKNKKHNLWLTYNCPEFRWLGGYTEKGGYDFIDDTFVNSPNNKENFHLGNTPKVTVLGGRMIGRFIYTNTSGGFTTGNWLIHSYGHTRLGFDTSGSNANLPKANTLLPSPATIADNYAQTAAQNMSRDNVVDNNGNSVSPNPFALHEEYRTLPPYYTYSSGMTIFNSGSIANKEDWREALKIQLNIHMIEHNPAMDTQLQEFNNRVNAARDNHGILAFEPNKVYSVDGECELHAGPDRDSMTPNPPYVGMCVGVAGNGATLQGTVSGTNLLSIRSPQYRAASTLAKEDYSYGFWVNDLVVNAAMNFDVALFMTHSSFFHLRNVTGKNARVTGVQLKGYEQEVSTSPPQFFDSGMYYGVLENVQAVANGNSGYSADGFDLFGHPAKGVRLANVGFYNCRGNNNKNRGLNLVGASVTFSRSQFQGNTNGAGYQIQAGETKSFNLIDCIVKGANSTANAIHMMKEAETSTTGGDGWVSGFHLLGGNLVGNVDQAPSTVNPGEYGLRQSMIHTASEPAVANNQVAARKGTIGNVVDATMSPGKPLPTGSPTYTSEEGDGQEP